MSDQEIKSIFDGQMERIHLVTGTRTQLELANFLGIRRSSIVDAKKRGRIPSDWLVTIMRIKGVHPEWILTGDGTCSILPSESCGYYEPADVAQERRVKQEALRRLSSKDLTDELLRRIVVSQNKHFTS